MYKIQGAGTIEKRGKNVWRIRFNLGADPITSKYRYSPWRTVHGTKAVATAALAEYRKEIESGLRLDSNKVTFAKYAEAFCEQREALGTYAPSTLNHEKYQIKHLNRYIGETLLRDIDSYTVQSLLTALSKEGKGSGAVKRAYKTLRQIMQAALMHDLITRNPCDKVKAPKTEKPTVSFLDSSQVARLLVALDEQEQDLECRNRSEEVRAIFQKSHVIATHIALATGMRRGEVLGLTWGMVNLEEQSIRVMQQMTSDGIRKPKSERGRRVISIDSKTCERLTAWKSIQSDYLSIIGIEQDDKTPVVSNESGEFCDPYNFSRWWRDFCKKHEFGGLRFHDLRHTQATLLISRGVDIKTVQGRLGHEKASTTLDLYAGILPEKDREAANVFGSLLA